MCVIVVYRGGVTLVRVVEVEMKELGYYNPFNDTIYIRKDLPHEVRKIVLSHETAHQKDRPWILLHILLGFSFLASEIVLAILTLTSRISIYKFLEVTCLYCIILSIIHVILEIRAWKKSGYSIKEFSYLVKKYKL